MTGTLSNPEIGEKNSTGDVKIVELVKQYNGLLNSENKFPTSSLAQSKLVWYTPKVIATEQTRENTEYGFLTTEDKIENIVVSENALVVVTYRAILKSSVASAGRAAIFFGATQAKRTDEGVAELTFSDTTFDTGYTDPSAASGWASLPGGNTVTTGQIAGGAAQHFLAAGTYTVGVKYRSTSGSVTVKDRRLSVMVLG